MIPRDRGQRFFVDVVVTRHDMIGGRADDTLR